MAEVEGVESKTINRIWLNVPLARELELPIGLVNAALWFPIAE